MSANYYPGDVIEPTNGTFAPGWTCPIDKVSSDAVRLAIDGVYGQRRWVKKDSILLRRRPFKNSIWDFVSNITKRIIR